MPKYGDYSDGAPAAGTDIVLVKRPSGPSTLRLTLANVLTYIQAALTGNLGALRDLASNGLIARTGSGTAAARTITAPAAGFTVSNGDGVSGNPTFALANDLAALEALAGTNTIYYRSAADTWSAVTVSTGLNFAAGTLTCTVSGGASAFTGLSDAPANYTSAANKLVQVNSGATGLQFSTTASVLDAALGSTQGAVAYRDGSGWTSLSPGSVGQVLKTNGAGANPTWVTPSAVGGGSVEVALPGTIADLAYWFESDNIVGTSGYAVPSVYNRTPWAAGSSNPNSGLIGGTISSSTLNGYQVLNFTGATGGGYQIPPIFGGKITVFLLFKLNTTGTYKYVLNGGTNSFELRFTNGNVLQIEKLGVSTIATDTTTFNTSAWHQANVVYNHSSGAYAFRVDRAASSSGTNAVGISGGSYVFGYASSNELNAQIAALIVYARDLNSTEIGNVETYLNTKWGV